MHRSLRAALAAATATALLATAAPAGLAWAAGTTAPAEPAATTGAAGTTAPAATTGAAGTTTPAEPAATTDPAGTAAPAEPATGTAATTTDPAATTPAAARTKSSDKSEPPVPFTEDYLHDAANIAAGGTIWADQCRHCHGAKAYPGKAPKLRPARYKPEFVYSRVTDGFRKMPAWKDVYTDEERMQITAYILSDKFSP